MPAAPINASTAPPPPPGGGASNVVGGLAKGAASIAKGMDPTLFVLFFGVLAIVVGVIYLYSRKREEVTSKYLRVYDPATRTWQDIKVKEVVPSIYATDDAKYIAFVPVNAQPDAVVDANGKVRYHVYPVVNLGGFYGWFDMVKGLGLVLSGMNTSEGSPLDPVETIITLYESKLLPVSLRLRPDVELLVYLDPNKVAKTATDVYDVTARQGLLGVANLTGQTIEAEKLIRLLISLETSRAEAKLTKYIGIAIVLAIVGFVATLVLGAKP